MDSLMIEALRTRVKEFDRQQKIGDHRFWFLKPILGEIR
jgi:hypothetical protein